MRAHLVGRRCHRLWLGTGNGVIISVPLQAPDMVKSSCLPVLKRFILDDEGLEISVKKRGAAPLGGGMVVFR